MGQSVLWLAGGALVALVLLATLNLSLRLPSRARIADQFRKIGRNDLLERLVARRPGYMLATAVWRKAATLLLFWSVLTHTLSGEASPTRTTVGLVGVLLLAWVFGVAIPHAWAKYAGETMLARLLPVLDVLRWSAYPITAALHVFDPLVRRLAGVPVRDAQDYADELEREILDTVREMERQGAFDEDEKEMIESVIELRDTLVQEVMTPRTEMEAIPKSADLDTVRELIRTKGHSRIPVFEETIDTILGVLYAKDLLHLDPDEPFEPVKVMRKVPFIPETKHVRDLLREFQQQRFHMAIVLDEYGGTAGLVTIEDILEELVGDIADEYEEDVPEPIQRIDAHTVDVDARVRIDELNHELDIELPEDEDYETIGGFVFSTLGKIPIVGERCAHENIAIRVIGAEPRRITRVRLHIPPTNGQHGGQA